MVFYFEITENIPFLTRKIQKTSFVLLFHFTFCVHFWLVKILSPNMSNYLLLPYTDWASCEGCAPGWINASEFSSRKGIQFGRI
jgi:hypothetical protein